MTDAYTFFGREPEPEDEDYTVFGREPEPEDEGYAVFEREPEPEDGDYTFFGREPEPEPARGSSYTTGLTVRLPPIPRNPPIVLTSLPSSEHC